MATLGEIVPRAASAQALSASATARQSVRPTMAASGLYSVYESQLENGTAITEFANADGRVFAVSWKGPVLPDFQGLLGSHFEAFSAGAKQARVPGRLGTPLNIAQQKLVVRSNGRMRHFFGYAYVPDLVPAGVNIDDVLR